MTDGKERTGMQAACDAALDTHGDHQAHDEAIWDAGAHASLAQQAAFAQACAPRGNDPRPGLQAAIDAWWPTPDRRGGREVAYDAGREQGRQETLLACAEERVLAASQPMSGEVRAGIDVLLEALIEARDTAAEGWSYAPDYFREKWGAETQIKEIDAGIDKARALLAMGTRTDVPNEAK